MEGVIKKTYQFYFRVSDTYEINDYWVHLMDHHINFAEKNIAFIKIGNAIYIKQTLFNIVAKLLLSTTNDDVLT